MTRQEMLKTLANMDSLQIRASYYDSISEATLTEVVMEVAAQDGRGQIASHVEECVCPPNYTGTSCEPGFFR